MRKYILVLLLLINQAVFAAFETGNDLLAYCESADAFGQGGCRGFIKGVSDISQEQSWYCKPKEIPDVQLVKVVVKSLNEHPEDLYNKPHVLVQEAFLESFPCD
jgi:hypothetical protein